MIVDVNAHESMVREGSLVAQFTRDVLSGSISAIENEGGDVVGLMGDAILAIFDDAGAIGKACFGIADDLDRQCEYISNAQAENPHSFYFAPGGPGLKIGIEFGEIEESTIWTMFLDKQILFAGVPIVYASRILSAGEGNRCLLGPQAAKRWLFPLEGPFQVDGKRAALYPYYRFDLGDIWREGEIPPGEPRSWR